METKRPILQYLSKAESDYYNPQTLLILSLIAIKYEPIVDERMQAEVAEIFEHRAFGFISIRDMQEQLIDVYTRRFGSLRIH